MRIRSSSSPAAAKAASRRAVTLRIHPVRDRVPEERGRRRTPARRASASDRSRAGRAPRRGCCGGGSRRGRARRGRASSDAVELARERDERMALGVVEPARHEVADPAERRRRRSPEPPSDVDGDRRRLRRPASPAMSSPGRARSTSSARRIAVATQQPHGAVARPQLERVRLLVGLVVLGRRHLEHGVVARRGDIRIAGECKRLAELDLPLGGDLARHCRERGDVRPVAHTAESRISACSLSGGVP